jgi:hypothetical protein
VTAPASERTLEPGAYLLGAVGLLALAGLLAFSAYRVRAALLPGWRGAPARLAESVLGVTALVLVSELLGSFDAYGELELIVATAGLAVLVALCAPALERRLGDGPASAPPDPGSGSFAKVLAVLACAGVAAAWAVPTLGSLAAGMDRADTLWYHMPLAAKFVQTGALSELFRFDPIFFASFYPANSEVVHAAPILAFGRDFVSPLLNFGFLAIGLLASWCIGRPYGVAPQALIGGSIALGAEMLVEFQAGEALNDITGVAFVLAAAALLVNGYAARVTGGGTKGKQPARKVATSQSSWAGAGKDATAPGERPLPVAFIAIAGLAAGLAAGTKLSFIAPVGLLFLGVVWISRGARAKAGTVFLLAALLGGGYWYARNAIAMGNPIPFTTFGPLDLPSPERGFELRPGFSVFHYLTDWDVISDWFVPGLDESFGLLWPLTLLALVGGGIYALWRGGDPVLRALGGMALATAIAYVFTPLTAGGEEGEPIAFVWNVRYIAPAAAVGLAILPCLPALRRSPRRIAIVTAALSILLLATLASLVQWDQGHTKGAIAAGLAVLLAFSVIAFLRSRGILGPAGRLRSAVALAAVVLLGAVAAGYAEQRHYLERRYENTSPELGLADALRWARDLRDSKVAVGGIRGVFNQYPFYGTDLSNEVQWLGIEGPDDAWLRIPTCEQWREEVNAGGYDYVVTTYDTYRPPPGLSDTKEALWTREDPASKEILRDGPVSVFAIGEEMDPGGCGDLPDLEPAELNGDSVNDEPRANQP